MMRTKNFIRGTLIVLFLAIILLWFYKVLKNKHYYNGIKDVFAYSLFLFDDATEYAPGYSEEAFKKIRIGSSKEDVLTLLGQPLRKETYNGREYGEIWRYTTAPPDRNYWFRIVIFDENDLVLSTERKYFVD